jgi:hypothetical protein
VSEGGCAVGLTREAGYMGDPSLRLKNGYAQDDPWSDFAVIAKKSAYGVISKTVPLFVAPPPTVVP